MKDKYLNLRIPDTLKAEIAAVSDATKLPITAIVEALLLAAVEAHKRDGMLAAPFSLYSKAIEGRAQRTAPEADRRKDAPGKKPRRRERPHGPHGPEIDQPVRERSA